MSSQTKRTLGRYVLIEALGGTALAVVYRALDTSSNREVAIKLLRPYFSQERSLLRSFAEYMEQISTLRHPNILPVYEVNQEGESLYTVEELAPWASLREQLRGPVDPREALGVLRQIAAAVDYAHGRGVIHRNIKPSNIFVSDDGRAVLSGFGMVPLAESANALVRTGLNTPLPTYTAPERAQGLPPNPRNDIYSLGVLFYEMVTGSVPFHALSPYTVLARQLQTYPTPPSEINSTLPEGLDEVVLKALARLPEERHSSARELVEGLEAVLGSTPVTLPAITWPDEKDGHLRQGGQESPVTAKELSKVQEDAPASEDTVVCPVCGHGNDPGTHNCAQCWARLGEVAPVTREEEKALTRKRTARRRRRRLMRWALAVSVVLGLGAWIAFKTIGTTQFLPPPASEISSVPQAGEWAMFGRDPSHTGLLATDSPVPAGELKWTFSTSASLLSSPAVVGGRVYLSTGDRRIIALDAETGDLVWERTVTGPVDSSPAVAGELVFVGLRDGRVIALDRGSGELVWDFETDNPVFSSPVVYKGILYVGSGDGRLYALDAATGEKRWSFRTLGWILASPVVNDEVVAVGSQDGNLYVIDTKTGKQRLAYTTVSPMQGSPMLQGDRLYLADEGGRLRALDWRKREYPFERAIRRARAQLFVWGMLDPPVPKGLIWAFQDRGGRFFSTPVAAWGNLYASSISGKLLAVDQETGKKIWEFQADGPLRGSPSVVGKTVLVGDLDGRLYALNAITGEQQWEFVTEGAIPGTPVVANGLLYVASGDGNLYVLK